MADFSSSDINEARRRVQEMHNRARSYVEPQAESSENENTQNNNQTDSSNDSAGFFSGLGDIFSRISSNDDSSLILAIILILSREKADNMLILALLYILL